MQKIWRARLNRGPYSIYKNGDEFYLVGPPEQFPQQSECAIGKTRDLVKVLSARGSAELETPSPFFSGQYHPRIWRGIESPKPGDVDLQVDLIGSMRSIASIFEQLRSIFDCVEPDQRNDNCFGIKQREIIILACTEIESAWRCILIANGYKSTGDLSRLNTKDYVKLLKSMRLNEWKVILSGRKDYGILMPFKNWSMANPTKSLDWYDAYNSLRNL